MPTSHSLHVADDTAPSAVENVPAPQGWQADGAVLPADSRYFPAAHSAHVVLEDAPDAPEYLPNEHKTQKVSLVFP